MKKSIFIICILLTSLWATVYSQDSQEKNEKTKAALSCYQSTAFNYGVISNIGKQTMDIPNIFYSVAPRFRHTVTKENLHRAKSIIDILPSEATQSIESYQSVKVSIIDNDHEIGTGEYGEGDKLNKAQLALLQSVNYSNHIFIKANYKIKDVYSGQLADRYLTYYITIVPEKEAQFADGYETLLRYIKTNSKEKTISVDQNILEPGKVSFTITKEGKVSNVKLTSTSGYSSIDQSLMNLMNKLPGKWNAATNSKREKVDQELVLFFGMDGC